VTPGSAPARRPHKLIVNKGAEELVFEYEDEEQALDKATPWVMRGYIARIADEQGVVKWTLALDGGQFFTYKGDVVRKVPASAAQGESGQPVASSKKPWWRFW
jgi:hypothetical protein